MNWVLLRGLYRQQRHWDEFPELLARSSDKSSVVCLDFPGCGTEAAATDIPWNIRAVTDELRERWLRMRGSRSSGWGLLAVSLGGMVALDWCERYPADFGGVALVNTSARNLGSLFERFNPAFYPKIARLLLKRNDPAREAAILEMTTTLKGAALDQALKRNIDIAKTSPIRTTVFLHQLAAAARFKAPFRLNPPAKVICSRGDQLVSPRCSFRLAKALGAPLLEHPWGGHDLPLDDPAWLVQAVTGA